MSSFSRSVNCTLDVGKLVLSPTRTYAPVIKKILDKYRANINGMIHCTGGGQTKILHFIDNLHIIKNNLFDLPPLFNLIKEESNTDWKEMYKVFNMGHRMELYLKNDISDEIIDIAKNFNLDAQVVGYVEKCNTNKLTICSPSGDLIY